MGSSEPRRIPALATTVLQVSLGRVLVGTLTRLPDDRNIWAFDPGYEGNPARPTLSLSFKTASGELASTRPSRVKLPPWFSNLLPEGHLRRYLALRGAVHPEREFFLLWLLGEDLPGAVRILPPAGHALPPPAADLAASDQAHDETLLRFSLAGVQLKFSALMESDGGLTIPVHGVGGDWIAKLPAANYQQVPENEYVMLTLAGAAGVTTPELRLVDVNDIHGLPEGEATLPGKALITRRFDRTAAGERIHAEDFAQVFNLYPHRKYTRASYENLARVLWAESGEGGIRELARRLAVTVLIGNGDMHLKNWSLIYPDRRAPELSPAYDFVATTAYGFAPELALSLGGTRAMEEVNDMTFRRFAQKAGVPDRIVVDAVRDTTARFREAWGNHPVKSLLPRAIEQAITRHLERVPLGRK